MQQGFSASVQFWQEPVSVTRHGANELLAQEVGQQLWRRKES